MHPARHLDADRAHTDAPPPEPEPVDTQPDDESLREIAEQINQYLADADALRRADRVTRDLAIARAEAAEQTAQDVAAEAAQGRADADAARAQLELLLTAVNRQLQDTQKQLADTRQRLAEATQRLADAEEHERQEHARTQARIAEAVRDAKWELNDARSRLRSAEDAQKYAEDRAEQAWAAHRQAGETYDESVRKITKSYADSLAQRQQELNRLTARNSRLHQENVILRTLPGAYPLLTAQRARQTRPAVTDGGPATADHPSTPATATEQPSTQDPHRARPRA